jgi:hypothetical protein
MYALSAFHSMVMHLTKLLPPVMCGSVGSVFGKLVSTHFVRQYGALNNRIRCSNML